MWERVPRREWGVSSKEKKIPVVKVYNNLRIFFPSWLIQGEPKRCNIYIDRENRLLGVQFSEKGDYNVIKRPHGFEVYARRALRELQGKPGFYTVVQDNALFVVDLKQDVTRKVHGS